MDQKQFEELKKKVEAAKRDAGVDLSTDEDLSIGVMNLISLEEHFFFTRVQGFTAHAHGPLSV